MILLMGSVLGAVFYSGVYLAWGVLSMCQIHRQGPKGESSDLNKISSRDKGVTVALCII